jgi:Zn-dependent peptidase ImmA (M78 family)
VAAQLSPVTPDVLRWAIEEDGRPVPELAEALQVDVDTVDGWTRGDAQPTRGQVTRMAEVLKRPRALFFMPRAPAAATLPPSFRHPPGDDRPISATARRWIRRARRVQEAVSWALRDQPPIYMAHFEVRAGPEDVAEEARSWTGVDVRDQLSWRDDYAALRGWREAIEDRGVLVFSLEIGPGEIRGFSAWDDRAPLIVANSSRANPASRIFTIGHELGHLFRRQDSTCVELGLPLTPASAHVGPNIERWCDQFSAALIMPEPLVRNIVGRAAGVAGIDEVRTLAARMHVSHRAAALRLVSLRLAPFSLYEQVDRMFVAGQAQASGSSSEYRRPSRSVSRPREYGIRTIRTVLDTLPPRDALSVLRMNVEDVRQLAEREPDVRVP